MSDIIYDLIIIGGGCAGLSAGVYAGRARLKTLILEKHNPGGQAANTAEVENYPGIRRTLGPTLTSDMLNHALDFGVTLKNAEIESAELKGEIKILNTSDGEYKARAVIIATGANPRKIGFEGENEFTGHGIAYCATCDGEFFSGLDIFVIGGGFAAADEAVYLTRFGKSVTVAMITPDFTCAKMVADKVKNHPKIKVKYNTELVSVSGDSLLRKAVFKDLETGELTEFVPESDKGTFGVFVFAGYEPATGLFKGQVDMDKDGYILTDDTMKTNLDGVYAAGDLRPKILRQIVTAVADGAIAATSAEKYVTEEKERLGIPMFEEEAPTPQKSAPQSPAAPVSSGTFLDAGLKSQLIPIFEKLTKKLTLFTVIDPSNDKSHELYAFLKEVAELSPNMTLESVNKGENKSLEEAYGFDKFPSMVLLDENKTYTGVKFSGIPGGHEMNSFVLAIYHLGAGDSLTDAQIDAINAINNPVKVQIAVSLSCHFCPDVVAAAQSIALVSNSVTSEMIDIALFPEIRDKYQIMSVPALIVNDGEKIIFGSKSLDEIIEAIK